MDQTPVYDLNDEDSEVYQNNQIFQDDGADPNELFGNYKRAQDEKRYVVPKEALNNYLNKQKKDEEKKEEEKKKLSRDQRPRAKPTPIQKKEEKVLTIREISASYKPRVSPFVKKAEEKKKKEEEEKKEENDEEESNM